MTENNNSSLKGNTAFIEPATHGVDFTGYMVRPELVVTPSVMKNMPSKRPGIVFINADGAPDKPLALLADEFAAQGYICLIPDFLFRMSKNREPVLFRDVWKVEDVVDAVRTIKSFADCTGEVAIVGFDIGCILGCQAAKKYSDEVNALICVLPPLQESELGTLKEIQCPTQLYIVDEKNILDLIKREVTEINFNVKLFGVPPFANSLYKNGGNSLGDINTQVTNSRILTFLQQFIGPDFDINAIWDQHLHYQMSGKFDLAVEQMTENAEILYLPTQVGAVGHKEILNFYQKFFAIYPQNSKVIPVSRIIGPQHIIDEQVFSFSHNTENSFLLPGVPVSNKNVQIPITMTVTFKGLAIHNQRIQWDQGSVLQQIGKIPSDPSIVGAEQATSLLKKLELY